MRWKPVVVQSEGSGGCESPEFEPAVQYRVRNDTGTGIRWSDRRLNELAVLGTEGRAMAPNATEAVGGTAATSGHPLPECQRIRVFEPSGLERDDLVAECHPSQRLILLRARRPTVPASIYPPPPQPLTEHTITVDNHTSADIGVIDLDVNVGGVQRTFWLGPGRPPLTMKTYYPCADSVELHYLTRLVKNAPLNRTGFVGDSLVWYPSPNGLPAW